MKDINTKDAPDVSGGTAPPDSYYPWPTDDPVDPADPNRPPFDPWTDPHERQS